jgi:hypothetical protein
LISGRCAIESNEGAGRTGSGAADRHLVAIRTSDRCQIVPFACRVRRIHHLSPGRAGSRQDRKRRKRYEGAYHRAVFYLERTLYCRLRGSTFEEDQCLRAFKN